MGPSAQDLKFPTCRKEMLKESFAPKTKENLANKGKVSTKQSLSKCESRKGSGSIPTGKGLGSIIPVVLVSES